MEFIYGLLTAVVFFIALVSFYYIGYKQGSKRTTKPSDINEEEVRKAKVIRKEFINMMTYDMNKALERKKV